MKSHFIFYVKDQEKSKLFYQKTLNLEPRLHVPGMTEFQLSENTVLGLMPETGIKRLLLDKIQDPEKTNGISRSELYLIVSNPSDYLARALDSGAELLSPLEARNWGDEACYLKDHDGHILAFAKPIKKN